MENGDVQFFFEVTPHPKVVVADKIIHGDPAVRKFCQFSEGPCKPSGDHIVVFKPEIEQIPQQEDRRSILFDVVEPADEFFLPWKAFRGSGSSQVVVAGEVYLLP